MVVIQLEGLLPVKAPLGPNVGQGLAGVCQGADLKLPPEHDGGQEDADEAYEEAA